MIVLSLCVLRFIAAYPHRAEFLVPVVFAESDDIPIPTLSPPVVFEISDDAPRAVFPVAVFEKSA
jgi:hypothetical protein